MSISETIEKVVQKLGGSVKFRKTPDGKDLYVRYNSFAGDDFYITDIEVPPYTVFIEITADGISDTYIIPVKTFVQGMGKIRGNEEALETFLGLIFASIF